MFIGCMLMLYYILKGIWIFEDLGVSGVLDVEGW